MFERGGFGREGGAIEAGYGSAEQPPQSAIKNKIEVGPEMPESRVEYGPDDSDITFVWRGTKFTVSRMAARVGAKILIELQVLRQRNPDWLVLEVTEVEGDPPMIKAVELMQELKDLRKVFVTLDASLADSFQAALKE